MGGSGWFKSDLVFFLFSADMEHKDKLWPNEVNNVIDQFLFGALWVALYLHFLLNFLSFIMCPQPFHLIMRRP